MNLDKLNYFSYFPIFPVGASTFADRVDPMFYFLCVLSLVATLGLFAALFILAVVFRRKRVIIGLLELYRRDSANLHKRTGKSSRRSSARAMRILHVRLKLASRGSCSTVIAPPMSCHVAK